MYRCEARGLRTLVAVTAISVLLMPAYAGARAESREAGRRVLELEVAEDGTRFSFADKPVFEDGLPAYGNAFVTQGYLYPAGTVTCTPDGCDGVLEDGSPEFPALVLGEWSCWGTHVGDGAHTVSGPWVVTTQQFSLGKRAGARTIVTSGYELADIGVPFDRAIVGGSGPHKKTSGEQVQTFLGFNPSFGTTHAMKLKLRD